jgi:hypothetical protein
MAATVSLSEANDAIVSEFLHLLSMWLRLGGCLVGYLRRRLSELRGTACVAGGE